MSTVKVGVIIVAYNYNVTNLIKSINAQKSNEDQIIIVANGPNQTNSKNLSIDGVEIIKTENRGFANGCNIAAKKLINKVDVLFLVNPDALLADGSLKALKKGALTDYSAWMGLLVLPNGRVNSAANKVHLSGLSWCDGYNQPSKRYKDPQDVSIISGACMMIRSDAWEKLDGLAEGYFLYYEDVDISTRMILRGMKMGLLPDAKIIHDYSFEKNNTKWFYIERNRLLYIVRTWPWQVIVLSVPFLAMVECGLWAVSILQGRFLLKIKSTISMLKALPWAIKTRGEIQKSRAVTINKFLDNIDYVIDTPLIKGFSSSRWANKTYKSYFKAIYFIVSMLSTSPSN